MRWARFSRADGPGLGLVVGDELVDLSALDNRLPRSLPQLWASGEQGAAAIERAVGRPGGRLPLAATSLLAPIERPGKFLCIGLNYADHAAETGREPPTFPTVFNKQVTSINDPGAPIWIPRESAAVDYEGELAFVVSRRCRRVSRVEARSVIAGFLVANDVSVRDWQARSPTMILGKGWDTHGPIGPWLTTPDEIDDPHDLVIKTWVGEDLRQHSSTRELIFDCYELIEILSTAMTLEPGDVISTGTPSGVGAAAQPPRFLRAGDEVRIEIEGLGALCNPVIAEPV